MLRNGLLSMVIGLIGVGYAHGLMRGSVAMKFNDHEAHVCLGDTEVKAGDKVKIGEGTILQTLNEHYSVMKVDPQVAFEEGTIVEKQ
jgi:hypothetical protein